MGEADPSGPEGPGAEADEAPLRCDFCGEEAPHVRRVALDEGYERLRTPHRERYACPACSERKEQARRGEAGG